jgi:hypothetical protein
MGERILLGSTNDEAPHYAVFARLPLCPPSQCQTFPQTPYNNNHGGAATELNKALCVSSSATAECRCRNGLCGSETLRRLFVRFGQQLVLITDTGATEIQNTGGYNFILKRTQLQFLQSKCSILKSKFFIVSADFCGNYTTKNLITTSRNVNSAVKLPTLPASRVTPYHWRQNHHN